MDSACGSGQHSGGNLSWRHGLPRGRILVRIRIRSLVWIVGSILPLKYTKLDRAHVISLNYPEFQIKRFWVNEFWLYLKITSLIAHSAVISEAFHFHPTRTNICFSGTHDRFSICCSPLQPLSGLVCIYGTAQVAQPSPRATSYKSYWFADHPCATVRYCHVFQKGWVHIRTYTMDGRNGVYKHVLNCWRHRRSKWSLQVLLKHFMIQASIQNAYGND